MPMPTSRREFIRMTCCTAASLGVAAGLNRFGLISALAQALANYRALVCIFLFGGNDGNNLIVPLDTQNYTAYSTLRVSQASGGLALGQAALLPVTARTGNAPFGFHTRLTDVQNFFSTGKLAVVANVGSIVQPMTRTEYRSKLKPIPANLFSHSDQQQQWQTSFPNGLGTTGWAGRAADLVQPINTGAQFPPITSMVGSSIFCTGGQTQPFAMVPGSTPGLQGFNSSAEANARLLSLQELLTFDSGVALVQATSNITDRALLQSATLSSALAGAGPLQTQPGFPTTSIGAQLLQVAKIMQVRTALGMKRQVFFCSMGGFDTHTNQIPDQDTLMSQLNPALKAFYDATVEIGVQNDVTSFTLSEFGRTFQPASGGGSDHGWGSHQIVLGGAVQGGDIYGRFPTFALGGPDDASSNGRWIPTTSIDQYAATFARWFGVLDADLPTIFPNLGNFQTPYLGFMG